MFLAQHLVGPNLGRSLFNANNKILAATTSHLLNQHILPANQRKLLVVGAEMGGLHHSLFHKDHRGETDWYSRNYYSKQLDYRHAPEFCHNNTARGLNADATLSL